MATIMTVNKRRLSLLTATTSILIAMAASMHPRRGKAQQRCASQIRHSQASPARLGKRGRVFVGKGWRILRALAIGNYDVELVRAISYLNRDVVHGPVIGDVIFNMVDGALGLDLGDGVGIGSRLVVLDVKGDISLVVWSPSGALCPRRP